MRLSTGEIATILSSAAAQPERVAESYSIDSRVTTPGSLFFALRGPRFDGHEFIGQALERGAVAGVVEQDFLARSAAALRNSLIPVPDVTRALHQLAHAVRQKWGRCLIGVTGSTGKTTTKELIAALLATRLNVHRSAGNLNNHYGVPLALLGLEPTHDVAVLELAMSASGEIARLTQMAEPQIGVVTNVAAVHLQFFDSVESIAYAKRELIENLKQPATAVLNYDDKRVRRFAEGFSGRVVTFGFSEGAEVRGVGWREVGPGRGLLQVAAPTVECELELHLPGRHNAENLLAAVAVATLFDLRADDLRRALASFHSLHRRSEVVELNREITLVDDSYNSNPLAMEKMLESLAVWPGARRRIVVAGEMLELGVSAPELHRDVGRKCPALGVDWIVAVQGDARFFLEGAVEAGMAPERTVFFSSAREAEEFCRNLIQPGDLVLVKGSRAVQLEQIVDALLQLNQSGAGNGTVSQPQALSVRD